MAGRTMVPCPNGGRCGHEEHEAGSSRLAGCEVSAAKRAAGGSSKKGGFKAAAWAPPPHAAGLPGAAGMAYSDEAFTMISTRDPRQSPAELAAAVAEKLKEGGYTADDVESELEEEMNDALGSEGVRYGGPRSGREEYIAELLAADPDDPDVFADRFYSALYTEMAD